MRPAVILVLSGIASEFTYNIPAYYLQAGFTDKKSLEDRSTALLFLILGNSGHLVLIVARSVEYNNFWDLKPQHENIQSISNTEQLSG